MATPTTDSRRLIDRLPPITRTKPMAVLVLSPARSGTTSVEAALSQLNFTVYKGMKHAFLYASRGENTYPQWSEALDAKYPHSLPDSQNKRYGTVQPYSASDFDKILGNYTAAVGWPASCFPDEMLAAYPTAKVILMSRPVDSWVTSMHRTLVPRLTWPSWRFLLPLENGLIRDCITCGQRCLNTWTDAHPHDRSALRDAYTRHNDRVRALVPPDRLLEYAPQQGWAPLCAFLDVPVPRAASGEKQDQLLPFPREAVGAGFEKQGRIFWMMALGKVVAKAACVLLVVGVIWYSWGIACVCLGL